MDLMNTDDSVSESSSSAPVSILFVIRAMVGGVLMGLANLVPGISGGTMLLAAGVYPEFVESIAMVTRLTRRIRPWIVLASIVVPAVAAIVLLAGSVKDGVVNHRWIAYSLFIGLTLGGAPTLWRMLRPMSMKALATAVIAFVGMVALALSQEAEPGAGTADAMEWGLIGLAVAGFAGAAAMVLPGVSGGYLLLLLGQYVPVLDAIASFKQAISIRSVPGLMNASIPLFAIGVGVVLGVLVVSNLIRWLLHRYREATLGALLGLLLGAVAGLWPFRAPVPHEVGTVLTGTKDGDVTVISEEHALTIDKERWPTQAFKPDSSQILGAIGLVAVGFGVSIAVGWLGTPSSRAGVKEASSASSASDEASNS